MSDMIETVTPSVTIKVADSAGVVLPKIVLTNFVVSSNNSVAIENGGIYWIPSNSKLSVTSDVTDEDGVISNILSATGNSKSNLVIIAERIRNGNTDDVIDDIRFGVEIDSTTMTLISEKGFDIGGNYVVTQERLNRGLASIGASFRIEMETVEFDVLND